MDLSVRAMLSTEEQDSVQIYKEKVLVLKLVDYFTSAYPSRVGL